MARPGQWAARGTLGSASGTWGALRLTTRGRHSGAPRRVMVGYDEDGRNLISMAMNGWGAAEPAPRRTAD